MLDDNPGASRRPSPFSWLNDLGFRRSDLAVFGAEARLAGRELQALHRDAAGRGTGWERVAAGPHGRLRYRHTEGGAKALFRSPPGRDHHRLLVADGALLAEAATLVRPAAAAAAPVAADEPAPSLPCGAAPEAARREAAEAARRVALALPPGARLDRSRLDHATARRLLSRGAGRAFARAAVLAGGRARAMPAAAAVVYAART